MPTWYLKSWRSLTTTNKNSTWDWLTNQYITFFKFGQKWDLFSFPAPQPEIQFIAKSQDKDFLLYGTYYKPGDEVFPGVSLNESELSWRIIHGLIRTVIYSPNKKFLNYKRFVFAKYFAHNHQSKSKLNFSEYFIHLNWHCRNSTLLPYQTTAVKICGKQITEKIYDPKNY